MAKLGCRVGGVGRVDVSYPGLVSHEGCLVVNERWRSLLHLHVETKRHLLHLEQAALGCD